MNVKDKFKRWNWLRKTNDLIKSQGASINLFKDNEGAGDVLEVRLGNDFTHVNASTNNYENDYFMYEISKQVEIRNRIITSDKELNK